MIASADKKLLDNTLAGRGDFFLTTTWLSIGFIVLSGI
jgi:hypothetical protein